MAEYEAVPGECVKGPRKKEMPLSDHELAKAKALKALSSLAYSNARSVGKAGLLVVSFAWLFFGTTFV